MRKHTDSSVPAASVNVPSVNICIREAHYPPASVYHVHIGDDSHCHHYAGALEPGEYVRVRSGVQGLFFIYLVRAWRITNVDGQAVVEPAHFSLSYPFYRLLRRKPRVVAIREQLTL